MFALLGRAFWIPLRKPQDILKTFWPLAFIAIAYSYILPYLVKMLLVRHENFPEVSQILNRPEGGIYAILVMFLLLFLLSYFVILIYDGLIKWHRHIILDEPAKTINLLPQKRNWRYIGWSLLFCILGLLIHFYITRKILPPASLQLPIDEQSYKMAIEFTMLRYTLTLSIFVLLFSRLFLLLPKNAVADSSFSIAEDLSISEKIIWTITILLATLVFMAAFFVLWKLAPLPEFSTGAIPLWLNRSDYTLHLILSLGLLFYEGFVMLTLLSLGYKKIVYGD